jgi:hypothetical protein
MTADLTRSSRVTKQEPRPTAGAVEMPGVVRRRDLREPHTALVQRAGRAVVDALAAVAEDASLATSR